ncbi:mannosyl-oligosaccharide alpha-1,2-mannosidase, partial [Cladophialophora yegresii CBS 114405]
SYHEKAWMRDELWAVSGGGRDTFGGWAATLIDALDNLWITELKDEFRPATLTAANINLSTSTDARIKMFETTIRYLGSFLAGLLVTIVARDNCRPRLLKSERCCLLS